MRGRGLRQEVRQLQRQEEAHARAHHRQAVLLPGPRLRQVLHTPLLPQETPQDPRQGRHCRLGRLRQRRLRSRLVTRQQRLSSSARLPPAFILRAGVRARVQTQPGGLVSLLLLRLLLQLYLLQLRPAPQLREQPDVPAGQLPLHAPALSLPPHRVLTASDRPLLLRTSPRQISPTSHSMQYIVQSFIVLKAFVMNIIICTLSCQCLKYIRDLNNPFLNFFETTNTIPYIIYLCLNRIEFSPIHVHLVLDIEHIEIENQNKDGRYMIQPPVKY